MSINDLLFGLAFAIMGLLTLGGGIAAVSVKNILHSALFLVMSFFGIAGIYLLLEAEFLAIVQVLIYVGAISVLILFAVMLTRGLMLTAQSSHNTQWGWAMLVSLLLFGTILLLAFEFKWKVVGAKISSDILVPLGTQLVTTYVLPFEVISLLLLAALVGAFVIARE